jgi:hypothetical protein
MANQVYIPLQSLRIERVTVDHEEKVYLVSSIQSWVYNYQYLKVKEAIQTGAGSFEIGLTVPNSAISQTTCLWSGEQRFELPYFYKEPVPLYKVKTTVYVAGQPTGVVTNTISGSGTIE